MQFAHTNKYTYSLHERSPNCRGDARVRRQMEIIHPQIDGQEEIHFKEAEIEKCVCVVAA